MRRKFAIWASAVIVALLGFAWIVLNSIDDMFKCDVTQHASLPSPDGSKQAVIFDVDCGATTGFNTQVSIAPSNVAFDSKAAPPILVLDGRWSLPIRWIDDRALHIRIPEGERIYRKLTSTDDVTVKYAEDQLP
jgi:hypothetical protein